MSNKQDGKRMMKNYDTDDTFLGRWIAGELSEEERIAFEKTDVFKQFDFINKESQLLQGPNIDTEAALKKVKQQLETKPRKPKVVKLWQYMAVASIVIISAGFFINSSKTYTTAIGETQTITLIDGSVINLNANSSLSHKRYFLSKDKQVTLTGEAYFTITKGDGFRVETSKGTVEVLGTQFNIRDREDFNLKCYEGKVRLNSSKTQKSNYVLTQGMQVSISSSKTSETIFKEETPSWKQGHSTFVDQPISNVLEELIHYYPIEFETNSINTNRLFTGSFIHSNLDTALKATLIPMGIEYKKSDTGNVIVLSE